MDRVAFRDAFNVFGFRNWTLLSDAAKSLGIMPSNQLWYDEEIKAYALTVMKAPLYGEYPLCAAALGYLKSRKAAVRYIILVRMRANYSITWDEIKEVGEVAVALENISPNDARFGAYWWLRRDFTPVMHLPFNRGDDFLDKSPFE
jgi:hypothetical protein